MQTLNFRALCQQYGISTKTGYKWRERFGRKGLAGMEEESRRPKSHSEQLPEEEVCEIVRLKLAHLSWGPRKIRELYLRRHGEVASESTFKRVLERAGLTQKRRRRRGNEGGRLCSGRRAAAPNEVWTVDFKGWWRSWGRRCEPLTVRDEHSRYVLELRAMEGASTEKVQQSFERLFERTGLPQAIRSDNGAPFASVHGLLGLSRLSAWWVGLGTDLERGRPGHPQDNGAHERLHRDISREIEALGQSDQAAMDVWRQSFNYERPHEALSMRCPGELYRVSERENTKASRRIWIIRRCALGASVPREQSNSMDKCSSLAPRWPAGRWASNRSRKKGWKLGLDVSCSERWIWRQAVLSGRISA